MKNRKLPPIARYDKRIEEGVQKHEAEAERNIATSDVRKMQEIN